MNVERLTDKCFRIIQGIIRGVREYPSDVRLCKAAQHVYERIATVPSDLIPVLLADTDHNQLLEIERVVHAQGCRIATEPFWKSMCLRDFGVSQKSAPDMTWRMTYERTRRAFALKREEAWLKEELEDLKEYRQSEIKRKKHPELLPISSLMPAGKKIKIPVQSSASGPIGHIFLPPGYIAPSGNG